MIRVLGRPYYMRNRNGIFHEKTCVIYETCNRDMPYEVEYAPGPIWGDGQRKIREQNPFHTALLPVAPNDLHH
jgi:hypothetical protein